MSNAGVPWLVAIFESTDITVSRVAAGLGCVRWIVVVVKPVRVGWLAVDACCHLRYSGDKGVEYSANCSAVFTPGKTTTDDVP